VADQGSAQLSVEHTLRLVESLHAPAHARAWVSARTPGLPSDTVEDALLTVSELVTNSVRHGKPDIVVSLATRPGRLRIEVSDAGESMPVFPDEQPRLDRVAGRGLLIVAATAVEWGVLPVPGGPGKTVWAELEIPQN
jgi:anti-sigma regulatory factor (Ser/Thr protein kinase)